MNFNQLKYVIEVVEEMSFSKAAEKLYISQPSLSQSIKALEQDIGIQIFSRKPLKLTYTGEVFVNWAKKVVASENQVMQKLSDIVDEKVSKIVIGIATHRSTYILPPVILEFKKEYPNCKIILEEHASNILQELMDNDKIDLLIDIPNSDKNSYTSRLIAKEKILLVTPAEWKLTYESKNGHNLISLTELKDKPFILLTQSQNIGKISRSLCAQSGFDPQILLECHNIETIYSMIVAGMGASFIPALFVNHYADSKDVNSYRIKNFLPEREIAVIHRKDKYISKPMNRFIEILSDFIKSNYN